MSSGLRVLYLNPVAQIGGAEHSLLDLAGSLDRRSFDPHLACLGDGPLVTAARARQLPVTTLPLTGRFAKQSLKGDRSGPLELGAGVLSATPLAWRIRRLAADAAIVHTNGNKAHLLSAAVSRRSRLVWHVRDFWKAGRLESGMIALANRRADAVIANSRAVAAHLVSMGMDETRVNAVPNGIDTVRFSPDGPIAQLRETYGWPAHTPLVGITGMLARWKGQDVLLRAVAGVLRARPDVRCVIAGDEIYVTRGQTGFGAELRQLAHELGIAHAVAFIGYRTDVPSVLRALDVVVHASVEPEPFGRVVAEAMACARPVIATNAGGVPEVTGPSGTTALLVPCGDAGAMAAAIERLLSGPEGARRLARAARERVVAVFPVDAHVARVQSIYGQLLEAGRRDVRPAGQVSTLQLSTLKFQVHTLPRTTAAADQAESRKPKAESLTRERRERARIRVLHVGKFYPPVSGGMERVLQLLCDGEKSEVDTRVLVANTQQETVHEVIDGVPVTRAASRGTTGSVTLCPSFPALLRRERADVIVIHEPNPIGLLAYALARPAGRLVIWFHAEVVRASWMYGLFYRPWFAHAMGRASRVIVATPPMTSAEQLQGFDVPTSVIPYGLDTRRLDPPPDVIRRAMELRERHPGPLVLFVGRLVPYKGLDVLIRAMTGIDATAVLIGSGPQRAELERLAAEAGVASKVVFAGETSERDLLAWYEACDLFVLPSVTRAEAFGVVQTEAMAAGKPVICTNLPSGVPWVNRDGETGLVVPAGDPVALHRAIHRLVRDEDLRRRFGAAGRRRVVEEFTVDRMAARAIAVYRDVLGEPAVPVPAPALQQTYVQGEPEFR